MPTALRPRWTPPLAPYYRSAIRRAYVGVTPEELAQQGASAADIYTYGAASAALSAGQAAQAWNELKKQQNFPAVKAVASSHTCPSGFLIAPDLETCVNQDNVHVSFGDSSKEWWWNSALSSFLRLNESGAWASSSAAADASLRGLRAMRMTTGAFGWSNVRSELRGVAQMLIHTPGAIRDQYGEDVDGFAFELEKSIAPYYDQDVANQTAANAKSDAVIEALIESQYGLATPGAPGSLGTWAKVALTFTAGAALGLYLLEPALARSLLSRAGSTLMHAPQTVRRLFT